MSNPLSLLNRLRSRTQRHEVALDDVLGVGRVEPQRKGTRKRIGLEGILTARHQAALLIHTDRMGEGRRVGQGWELGREAPGR